MKIEPIEVFTLAFLPWRFKKESIMIQLLTQKIKLQSSI